MLHQAQQAQQQHKHHNVPFQNNIPVFAESPFPQYGQRRGRWILKKTLGSGGFGTVTLWKNEETEEEIAIKKCRLGQTMSEKNCRRWKSEVDIMRRLNHDNVIRGLMVPEGLETLQQKDDLPLLAMEYCAGGDLRKVFNNPKNCCGMSEYEVRNLAHDTANAVDYLHKKRIIHRDLKPENIVLKYGNERIIYKLIDLGYAKELDQSSVCQSFVGTLQYLAPELFHGKKYTQTVDYWSFGAVIFEALTGLRPFLPNLAPLQWHTEVKKKSDDDICAYIDQSGEVKFSKKLLTPNHVTSIMQKYFEEWLRLMLRWDPDSRGGGTSNQCEPNCFLLLNRILKIQISHILDVETNTIISIPISGQDKMYDLQKLIEQQTNILVEEQDILLASGRAPDFKQPASQCLSEPERELLVYLFRKGDVNLTYRPNKALPKLVELIVKNPQVLLSYPEKRKAWAHSVYFCQQQNQDFRRLSGSQRAAMISLLRGHSDFVEIKNKMMSDAGKMIAKKVFFRESLEYDMLMYEEQKDSGIKSQSMFSKWERIIEDIDMYDELMHLAKKLEEEANILQVKIVQLQNSPFAKYSANQQLIECEERAKDLYSCLRQAGKGNE